MTTRSALTPLQSSSAPRAAPISKTYEGALARLRDARENASSIYCKTIERRRDALLGLSDRRGTLRARWRRNPQHSQEELEEQERALAALAREEAELDSGNDRVSRLEARASDAARLVEACERWLADHADALAAGIDSLEAISATTTATPAALTQIRAQIDQTEQSLVALEAVPAAAEDLRSHLASSISRKAADFGESLVIAEGRSLDEILKFRTGAQADPVAFICWLHGDRLLECLSTALPLDGLTAAERMDRDGTLRAELAELHRREEAICRGLEGSGLDIPRRPSAPPDVVLAPEV